MGSLTRVTIYIIASIGITTLINLIPNSYDMGVDRLAKYEKTEFYKQTKMSYEDYTSESVYSTLSDVLETTNGTLDLPNQTITTEDMTYQILESVNNKDSIAVTDNDYWDITLDGVLTKIPNYCKDNPNLRVIVGDHVGISDPLGLGYVIHVSDLESDYGE